MHSIAMLAGVFAIRRFAASSGVHITQHARGICACKARIRIVVLMHQP